MPFKIKVTDTGSLISYLLGEFFPMHNSFLRAVKHINKNNQLSELFNVLTFKSTNDALEHQIRTLEAFLSRELLLACVQIVLLSFGWKGKSLESHLH